MRARRLILLVALGALASSCAYYNTFYLARKNYYLGTAGQPYPVTKPDGAAGANFTKAIDFSKKVLADYPKSKWVDDAYLLWACSLLGREDPRETVNMLQDFGLRFPDSKLKPEALFYLGVGYRQSHRYGEAEVALAQFLEQAPKNQLAPYAWLERSRALTSLDRDSAAAYSAGQVLDRFPKSRLAPLALAARAQALMEAGDYPHARSDFQALGVDAHDDEERLTFMLREADCLEAAHDYPTVMAMLKDALARERPPLAPEPDAKGVVPPYQPTPGGDRYGRILMRIGSVELLSGSQKEALASYDEILHVYPKSPLSAEAQYRIGYAYETVGDDFDRARSEYGRVKDEFANSAFAAQAQSRLTNLDRLTQFRTAGGDTLQKRAEAGYMLAELYLFQLNKPERALEEYGKVAEQLKGTAWAAKALTGQAWVLSRKLQRQPEADSLLWEVVHHYPATEAQLAARDYLEQAGAVVPDSLIQPPKAPLVAPAPVDTTPLTRPPEGSTPLGIAGAMDTLGAPGPGRPSLGRPGARRGFMHAGASARPAWDPRYAGTGAGAPSVVGDSPFTGGSAQDVSPPDSARGMAPPHGPAPHGSPGAPGAPGGAPFAAPGGPGGTPGASPGGAPAPAAAPGPPRPPSGGAGPPTSTPGTPPALPGNPVVAPQDSTRASAVPDTARAAAQADTMRTTAPRDSLRGPTGR